MPIVALHDIERIERFLRRDAALHVYALADLDERFWPRTDWHGLERGGELEAVAFVFRPLDPPVVYAVSAPDHAPTARLLSLLADSLPHRFWADVAPGMEGILGATHQGGPRLLNYKMALGAGAAVAEPDSCERLGLRHGEELAAFYRERAYAPGEEVGRYFDPYMLELGPFFGVRAQGRLVAAGGFHVNSRPRRVAAIGNIATAPDHRGRGHARRITQALCAEARDHAEIVGLNVACDNIAAVRLYANLGFQVVGEFVEQLFNRREGPR